MTPRDWTLMTISSGEGPLQPVQLQKSLFIISKKFDADKLKSSSFYPFDPYDYGPFCGEVYSDAERLEFEGLITITRPPISRYRQYQITEKGRELAKSLKDRLDPEVKEYLETIVNWTQSLTFNQLVSSIYAAFPEMKANSVFQG
ncbi:hypothetical protein [Geothrix sp. SG200]|uniref:hypothetical protein n=1 Tax=Geothrix sp. SG200 TaxID=2922865 RepID=UPI001FAD7FFB|nr:hypothetical protein [Geothrix sp. SG200]